MAPRAFKASTTHSDVEQAVLRLAADSGDVDAVQVFADDDAEVELAMADLVSDDNGEIVIFNDSGYRTLALRTNASVIANGQAQPHVTAGGEDVTGYKYLRFDNGLTLYFEEELHLILQTQGSGSAA